MKIESNILEQTVILKLSNVFTTEQCKTIADQILTYRDRDLESLEFNRNANAGCWMGEPLQNHGFTKEIANLIENKLRMCCTTYYEHLTKPANILTSSPPKLYDEDWTLYSWANINDPGSENREHTHTGSLVSGVVYFDAEDTGRLEFMPYNYTYKMAHPAWPYYGVTYYEPKNGDVLLFPSFLLHRVERNSSNKPRINMAFDGNLVPERQLRCYKNMEYK